MPETAISGYKCSRCKHVWAPRIKSGRPTVCPRCHNAWWDKPKRRNKK